MPLPGSGQRARLGCTASARRRPLVARGREDVDVVESLHVVRAAEQHEARAEASERCALPALGRNAGRPRAGPRVLRGVEEVQLVGVGARVAAEDGENGAGRGAGDVRCWVGRAAIRAHHRPIRPAGVERVHVIVAVHASARRAAAENVQRRAYEVHAVAAPRRRLRAGRIEHVPLDLLFLQLEKARRSGDQSQLVLAERCIVGMRGGRHRTELR